MSLFRGADPERPDPHTGTPSTHELRPARRPGVLGYGTLACPDCDAPVLPDGPVGPTEPLHCPFCARRGAVRDFLSLGEPTRPTRVEIRIVTRLRIQIERAKS